MRCTVLLLALALAACSSLQRPPRDAHALQERRAAAGLRAFGETERISAQMMARLHAEHQEWAAGRRARPPQLDILVISGGGDWGGFGASFLKGWAKVPASHPLALPRFDAVTGVSTGALIAPFAFLGDVERVAQLYRNPRPDWLVERGVLFFLPSNASFADIPGLEREVREHVTLDLVRRIAAEGEGRVLAVNTTNLDDASSHVFDLVAEARAALAKGSPERVQTILLASSGIPAAFPHREIDGAMYVDGGITGNLLYGGRGVEERTLPALWQKRYPGVPIPRIRFWVIFNNQLQVPAEVVKPRWPDIMSRSRDLATRTASVTAMRHLYAMAEISRLRRGASIEVRVVAVPDDWVVPAPGVFIKETMNAISDLGEKMGADPASWRTELPH